MIDEFEDMGLEIAGEPAGVVEPIIPAVEPPAAAVEDPAPVAPVEPAEPPKEKNIPGSQRAKEKAMRLEIENQYLREQLAGKTPEPAPVDPNEPKAEAFENYEDYQRAIRVYDRKVAYEDAEWAVAQTRIQSEWTKKKEAIKAVHPDVETVFENTLTPSKAVAEIIYTAPDGAELGYYLGTHEEEYERINNLSPVAAAFEMGAIRAKLTKPATPKQTSQAPPPVVPLAPSGIVQGRVLHAQFEDF